MNVLMLQAAETCPGSPTPAVTGINFVADETGMNNWISLAQLGFA